MRLALLPSWWRWRKLRETLPRLKATERGCCLRGVAGTFRGAGASSRRSSFGAWNGLFEAALTVHDRALQLIVEVREDLGDDAAVWMIPA